MRKLLIGAGILSLLLLSIVNPIISFASDTKDTVESYGEDLYKKSNTIGDENCDPNIYIEREEGEIYSPSKTEKNTIPYQEVPRVPEQKKPTTNNTVVEGGNEKASNPLATKEHKARGTVIENVNRKGKDITPKTTVQPKEEVPATKTQTENPVSETPSSENKPMSEPMARDENGNIDVRQFLTFQTKSGKSFHLIIDHAKNSENVQLLTEVGEQDLLNMIEGVKPKTEPVKESKSLEELQKEKAEKEKLEAQKALEKEKEEKEKKKKSPLFMILILAIVGGAGYYFKIYKPKQGGNYFDDEEEDDDFEDFDDFDEYLEDDVEEEE